MQKTILITGSTDGIGLATAKLLASQGHTVLLHGRNAAKLADAERSISALPQSSTVDTFVADLSHMSDVSGLADAVAGAHAGIDVLINNAGILRTSSAETPDGLDIRFAVNTIAPYLLTQKLLPLIRPGGRVVNVSSAAQSPVDVQALAARAGQSDMEAYAQSKLALTMWSRHLAQANREGPVIVAVNPGSMLGSKMVQQGFGVTGGDIQIGADILARAALSDEFSDASGLYFDNDSGRFAPPHPDALDDRKCLEVVSAIERVLSESTR
ncbi:SDR family NAD(P)-dependent oxidoreductase [Hoeflea sp.]|uniref:SDR family NAD(P)-dependent oxidoreductase n=1 Tax=Hoeflea sp. TaxID=1940281 RepID=UPI003B010D4A